VFGIENLDSQTFVLYNNFGDSLTVTDNWILMEDCSRQTRIQGRKTIPERRNPLQRCGLSV